MNAVLAILSIAFAGIGLWISVLNWSVVLLYLLRRQKASSWIPLLGGICCCVACFLLPYPGLSYWWWLPFFLDWGSVPGIVFTLGWLFLKRL